MIQKICIAFLLFISACIGRVDPNHVLIRSDIITSMAQRNEIVSRAKILWTSDRRIPILYVNGTPYERGYQHGVLLRKEIKKNFGKLYKEVQKKFRSKELLAEVYERLRPFIPQEYIDEMQGLAHGAEVPLEMIHHIHALPSLTEWGGKRRLKELVKDMLSGELGPSCSNFAVLPAATADKQMYSVRVLDWGLHKISDLQKYPLITVNKTDNAYSANIGWVGFLGAVSGFSSNGITLGEMGYDDPDYETLRGMPMVFLLREVMDKAKSIDDARRIIETAPGTNSFAFLISDGKSKKAELYVKDSKRFLVFKPGDVIKDEGRLYPAIDNIVYGGHDDLLMHQLLSQAVGDHNVSSFRSDIIPKIALKSNFQNVIYSPETLEVWISNAKDAKVGAAFQKYTYFNLKELINTVSCK